MAPLGRPLPSSVPAPCARALTELGMLTTIQCQNPAPPVGASGSCTMTAKLCVPSGAPDHATAGETLSPVQPKSLNANLVGMVAPGAISALSALKVDAI